MSFLTKDFREEQPGEFITKDPTEEKIYEGLFDMVGVIGRWGEYAPDARGEILDAWQDVRGADAKIAKALEELEELGFYGEDAAHVELQIGFGDALAVYRLPHSKDELEMKISAEERRRERNEQIIAAVDPVEAERLSEGDDREAAKARARVAARGRAVGYEQLSHDRRGSLASSGAEYLRACQRVIEHRADLVEFVAAQYKAKRESPDGIEDVIDMLESLVFPFYDNVADILSDGTEVPRERKAFRQPGDFAWFIEYRQLAEEYVETVKALTDEGVSPDAVSWLAGRVDELIEDYGTEGVYDAVLDYTRNIVGEFRENREDIEADSKPDDVLQQAEWRILDRMLDSLEDRKDWQKFQEAHETAVEVADTEPNAYLKNYVYKDVLARQLGTDTPERAASWISNRFPTVAVLGQYIRAGPKGKRLLADQFAPLKSDNRIALDIPAPEPYLKVVPKPL